MWFAVLALGVYWLVDVASQFGTGPTSPIVAWVASDFLETLGSVIAMVGGLLGLVLTAARCGESRVSTRSPHDTLPSGAEDADSRG